MYVYSGRLDFRYSAHTVLIRTRTSVKPDWCEFAVCLGHGCKFYLDERESGHLPSRYFGPRGI
jgi:hypothetical protein